MTVNINAASISSARFVEQASNPATPSSGSVRLFVDNSTVYNNTLGSNTPLLKMIADDGTVTTFIGNVTASGVGVTFPPQQVASSNANTLDDYEEGTYTPTLLGSSTSGTPTYSTQAGRYTKIGNVVFVQAIVFVSTHNGSGRPRISLPTVVGNAANSASFFTWTTDVDWPSGSNVLFQAFPGQAYADLYSYGDNITSAAVTDLVGSYEINGFYFV